uniref:Uncharacterized protein n=1 Tax=Arundo donax TaxID=35708 RepID=A0A0A8ZUM1_ARUDO
MNLQKANRIESTAGVIDSIPRLSVLLPHLHAQNAINKILRTRQFLKFYWLQAVLIVCAHA